ncbi:uncharacterized protein LOC121413085 [Lytechinus variegatus]|uniref:uncharacterized protein LOC121413085 n=1 Tax=Lytechinus variegatus TaxID=7654 RepID=UPI001BB1751C|nr:uncharacterized protein LOC121413085 [Lytechinus variegatus]
MTVTDFTIMMLICWSCESGQERYSRSKEELVIEKPCRRTASEDLAEFMCSSNTLSSLTIRILGRRGNAHMHDVFYSVLARNATDTKIECLDINYIDLSQRQSASRDLAQFICKMPHLKKLRLYGGGFVASFNDEFYSTLSSLASSSKIERLDINYIDLSQCQSTSRDLAQFICKMPHLKELHLGAYQNSPKFHDEFYSTLSSLASSAKVYFQFLIFFQLLQYEVMQIFTFFNSILSNVIYQWKDTSLYFEHCV